MPRPHKLVDPYSVPCLILITNALRFHFVCCGFASETAEVMAKGKQKTHKSFISLKISFMVKVFSRKVSLKRIITFI